MTAAQTLALRLSARASIGILHISIQDTLSSRARVACKTPSCSRAHSAQRLNKHARDDRLFVYKGARLA